MEWTNEKPKVSGYYWLFDDHGPKIVKVKIDNDPEYPVETYSVCNYESEWGFKDGDKWAGPIPPPSVNAEQRIQTSQGEIVIREMAFLIVEVPVTDRLVISFRGEKYQLSAKVWLDNAKEGTYTKAPPNTPPSSSQV